MGEAHAIAEARRVVEAEVRRIRARGRSRFVLAIIGGFVVFVLSAATIAAAVAEVTRMVGHGWPGG